MRRAFTLVEVMVGMGILFILIALLSPVIVTVREKSKTVKCLANLRQLGQAAITYAAENEAFPPSSYRDGTGTWNWDWHVVNGQPVGPGTLWKTHAELAVNQCPAWEGSAVTNFGGKFSGYNYNVSYVGGEPQGGRIPCQPMPVAKLARQATTALFGDGETTTQLTNTFMRSPLPSPSEIRWLPSSTKAGSTLGPATGPSGGDARKNGAQGFRHQGASNVVFADGHAETISRGFFPAGMPGPEVGFLSSDNSLYGG